MPWASVSPAYVGFAHGSTDGAFVVRNHHTSRKMFLQTVPVGDRPFVADPECALIGPEQQVAVTLRLAPDFAANHDPGTWSALTWVHVKTALVPRGERV